MYTPIFNRDLLYPTDNLSDPGSVHIAVMCPDANGKLPVFISAKSRHNPMDYSDTVLEIIQSDIFDKTRINIKNQGIFFFRMSENKYVRMVFKDEKQITEVVSNMEINC